MSTISQNRAGNIDRMQVRIEHLDQLLNLAGEVIISSTNLQELKRQVELQSKRGEPLGKEDIDIVKSSSESAVRISQDLHELVMAIRLVEIGGTMRLFRRPIRDLCRKLGREVDLVLEGEETLIDKTLAERLADPILHLLRNAVDHGIEAPLERTRAGKEAQAKLVISAIDQEYHTEIIVRDDGRGIDEAKILAKAREKGLSQVGDEVSILDVLCSPGFSSAETVTSTSGRGVGLDLVKGVVEEFDGTLDLDSRAGEGACFTLTIPKLRAVNIMDTLTFSSGGHVFAVPIEQVVASIGIQASQIESTMGRARYFTYQDEVVVIHDLLEILGEEPLTNLEDPIPVVVVQEKEKMIALIISEFLGPQKLVKIPLSENLPHAPGISGTFVYTGGKLGLTIDIEDLIKEVQGEEGSVQSHLQEDIPVIGDTESPIAPEDNLVTESESQSAPVKRGVGCDLDDSIVTSMVVELTTNLAELQDTLLNLENNPEDIKLVNEAFRFLHAVKGNFAMLEVSAPTDVAHRLETVLDFMRNGRLEINPERMDLFLDGMSYLQTAMKALPQSPADPADEFLEKLNAEAKVPDAGDWVESEGEILGRLFTLTPTLELQVLSALKRGSRTYESFVTFKASRQADFLVAYLILRRLGREGSILATLPPVDEIESGQCGRAVKVLWSTSMDEDELETISRELTKHFNVTEFNSVPATIFRHEST